MKLKIFSNKQTVFNILKLLLTFLSIFVLVIISDKIFKKKEKIPLDREVNLSSFNAGSSGMTAYHDFVKKVGLLPAQITERLPEIYNSENISHLTKEKYETPSVLLIADPDYYNVKEFSRLEKAAEGGFSVIILTDYKAVFLELIAGETSIRGVSESDIDNEYFTKLNGELDRSYITGDVYGLYKDLDFFSFESLFRFKKPLPGYKEIISDKLGIIAIEKQIGSGRIIIISQSGFIQNVELKKRPENYKFLHRLVQKFANEKIIYFDEYIHGFSKRWNLFYFIMNNKFRIVSFNLIIMTVILLLFFGKRFGQFKRNKQEDKYQIYRYSDSLASLYAKKKYYKDIYKELEKIGHVKTLDNIIERGKYDMKNIKEIYNKIKAAKEE